MNRNGVSYELDPLSSSFVIRGYNWAKPFSNFLPGIAGKWGIPLWVYYVNAGQALASVGVRDKDGQILEFQSFNQAQMRVAREGFRTFLRLEGGHTYEPFRKTDNPSIEQTMIVSSAELTLRERHQGLGLEIEVVYFTLPNLPHAALARQVFVRDLLGRPRDLEWLDGLPRILPHGLDLARSKGIPRHIEAMMGVAVRAGVPLFRLKQTPDDVERVEEVRGGNYYLSVGSRVGRGVVVDAEAIFGEPFRYDWPWVFSGGGSKAVREAPQVLENRTPAAFTVREDRIASGGEISMTSLIGYVREDQEIDSLRRLLRGRNFINAKRIENRELIGEITDRCFTVSSSPHFDAYAGQNFLDNVIRGGMPLVFNTARGKSAFYLYSRQNGDLERDYHFFVVEPTYLSQGTGHYRSVLQNRRADTWFFPEVEDANLRTFVNLIQLDGYNPLEVLGLSYRLEEESKLKAWLRRNVSDPEVRREILAALTASFTPGELTTRLEQRLGELPMERSALLENILRYCTENEVGGIHEGFWVDHWHYNIDLLEVVLMVYPDRLEEILVGRQDYSFFDDPLVILPRSQRTVDAGAGRIRAYGAVVRDAEKEGRIASRPVDHYRVRTGAGNGDTIYRTHLLGKLLTVVLNRLATLDPAGTGIEMEAGKPGWNDSMNGLPGLFGSGLSETLELRRTVRWLRSALDRIGYRPIKIFRELAQLARGLRRALRERLASRRRDAAYRYWAEANRLKEVYRERTRLGVDGAESVIRARELLELLEDAQTLLDRIFEAPMRSRVVSKDGVPHTYFVNEVVRSRPTGETHHQGFPLVEALGFRQRPVKSFLEGPVHWMKDRPHEAEQVYGAVRRSGIYDRALRMYKSCENLSDESFELGRAVGAYPRGWIENESIYLHMEYKYLLEILRSGMVERFWKDARHALVPFQDPSVYGRSTLEGASFIVSSAYSDARYHGRAFQPRLSGITCEFLHIWILAVAGPEPFRIGREGSLELALRPRLPGAMFTEKPARRRYHDPVLGWEEIDVPEDGFAFKFLGHTLVIYRNPGRRPTFGQRGASPSSFELTMRDGRTLIMTGSTIPSPVAEQVRSGKVRRIEVILS